MRRITELIRDYSDAYVLSDEIYDRLVFQPTEPVFSPASVTGMRDRTIVLDGFSKTYAMTGWRLGYGLMNANMAEEQVNASKYLVLQQTAVAMLAQANQAPQFLLSLFQ